MILNREDSANCMFFGGGVASINARRCGNAAARFLKGSCEYRSPDP